MLKLLNNYARLMQENETLAGNVGSGQPPQSQTAALSPSASHANSINDLLLIVNQPYQSVFLKDVLQHSNGVSETVGRGAAGGNSGQERAGAFAPALIFGFT